LVPKQRAALALGKTPPEPKGLIAQWHTLARLEIWWLGQQGMKPTQSHITAEQDLSRMCLMNNRQECPGTIKMQIDRNNNSITRHRMCTVTIAVPQIPIKYARLKKP